MRAAVGGFPAFSHYSPVQCSESSAPTQAVPDMCAAEGMRKSTNTYWGALDVIFKQASITTAGLETG